MVYDSTTLSPAQVAQEFIHSGLAKHKQRADTLFGKAFVAGVFLSAGALFSIVAAGGSPGLAASNPGLVKLLGGFVFPVGLVMIVLQKQELLTSNMMIFPMCLWKRTLPWWSLPFNWIIVFLGNLAGSLFFAAILVKYSGIISSEPYLSYIHKFTVHKAMDPSWHQIFIRGIGCNWLVCIAVWQATAASEVVSKVIAIWIPIWVFVACGFDHVIANMFFIPAGIMLGAEITVAEYIRKSLIAAFLGNVVGALFVAVPFTYFYLYDGRAECPHDTVERGGVSDATLDNDIKQA